MAGRPSVNKRQRELLRKERQVEKLSRRDERRNKRNLVDPEPSPVIDPPDVASATPPALDSTSAK